VPDTVLIVNPRATRVTSDTVAEVARELGAHGELEVHATQDRGHATELARGLPRGVARLFGLGGDGLFNELANGVSPDVAIGLLPAGSSNVLPRALGLPGDVPGALARLGASSSTRTISLGSANGRRFTFACGLGVDAEIVRAVDARGRKRGKRPGDHVFAWELTKLLVRRRFRLEPTMEITGSGRCAFAATSNGDPYTFAGRIPVRATPLARFDAGLDVIAPRRLGPFGIAGLAYAVLLRPGRQTRASAYIYLHDADAATISCDRPTALQVDGEDLGDVSALELGVERDAMRVLT
jgi:diacylglycerol kinase family enzyme